MGRMKRSLRALLGTISPPCTVLRAASLLEAIVAAVVLLLVFTATMELLPRFTLRNDDALLVAEAEYRVDRAFDTYASGVWPRMRMGMVMPWLRSSRASSRLDTAR